MGRDIVITYKRKRLTSSRNDKPHVNLRSHSPSEIPEPNSSTRMSKESKVDDQLHIHDSAKSNDLPNNDQSMSGIPSDVSAKRNSLTSLDLSVCPTASRDIDLNRPLDFGSDEDNLTKTSKVNLSVDLTNKLKENMSSKQKAECSSPGGVHRNKGKAPAYSSSTGTSATNAYLQDVIMPMDEKAKFMDSESHKYEKIIEHYMFTQGDVFGFY